MTIDIRRQEQNYQNPSTGAVVGGIIAGSAVQSVVGLPQQPIATKITGKMRELNNALNADEFSKVEQAVATTLRDSGLEAKGVEIIKGSSKNKDEILKIMQREYDNHFIFKHLPEKWKSLMARGEANVFTTSNCGYTGFSKKIITPEKGFELGHFHEIGHALNADKSKCLKFIQQKYRPVATYLLVPTIAAIALYKTKKAPGEEPKNKTDKTTTFIKNNAGKLAFAAFIPIMLEEGLANLKGNKFAKQFLDAELAKKVAKSNKLGFSTYLLLATLSGLGIYLGTKVKDAIAHKNLK